MTDAGASGRARQGQPGGRTLSLSKRPSQPASRRGWTRTRAVAGVAALLEVQPVPLEPGSEAVVWPERGGSTRPGGGRKHVACMRRPQAPHGAQPRRPAAGGQGALPVLGPGRKTGSFRAEGSWAGTWRGPAALGEQLQHLPGAPALLQQGVPRAGSRLVQLPHQGLSLLHSQLPCLAPQALQVGQQGGEVLVGDLCRRDEGRSAARRGDAGPRGPRCLQRGPWVPALPLVPQAQGAAQCPHRGTEGLGAGAARGGVLESSSAGASPAQVLFSLGAQHRKEGGPLCRVRVRETGGAVQAGLGDPLRPPYPPPSAPLPPRPPAHTWSQSYMCSRSQVCRVF